MIKMTLTKIFGQKLLVKFSVTKSGMIYYEFHFAFPHTDNECCSKNKCGVMLYL